MSGSGTWTAARRLRSPAVSRPAAAASKSPRSPATKSRSLTIMAAAASGPSGDLPGGFAIQDTLSSPTLRRMFIEIHPALIEADKMQRFLGRLQQAGFETTHVISRDNWQRGVLGQAKVEELTLSQLMRDERILQRRNAFEIFFKKHGESR